ncbi:hypothetical protein FPQ18DRAFT_307198 [Pyronema domesticum]|nr:hypothetical protein FPQ18DRAFT_307198 [Pyronema domesticum]
MDLQNYIYCRFSPPRLNRNYLNSIVDEADWPINTNPEHGLNILGHSNLDSWKTRDHRLRKRQETFAHAIRIRSSESIPYYVKELSGIMRQKNVLPPRDEDNPPYCLFMSFTLMLNACTCHLIAYYLVPVLWIGCYYAGMPGETMLPGSDIVSDLGTPRGIYAFVLFLPFYFIYFRLASPDDPSSTPATDWFAAIVGFITYLIMAGRSSSGLILVMALDAMKSVYRHDTVCPSPVDDEGHITSKLKRPNSNKAGGPLPIPPKHWYQSCLREIKSGPS